VSGAANVMLTQSIDNTVAEKVLNLRNFIVLLIDYMKNEHSEGIST